MSEHTVVAVRVKPADFAAADILCHVVTNHSQSNRFAQAQRIQRAATNRAIRHGGAVVDVLNACILEA